MQRKIGRLTPAAEAAGMFHIWQLSCFRYGKDLLTSMGRSHVLCGITFIAEYYFRNAQVRPPFCGSYAYDGDDA